MPPKELKNEKYFINIDEENYVPLYKISDIEISSDDISEMKYETFDFNGEIEIVIEPPQNYRELKTFIELVHPSLPWLSWWSSSYGNNNWRKLHGLPIQRRRKGRK